MKITDAEFAEPSKECALCGRPKYDTKTGLMNLVCPESESGKHDWKTKKEPTQ